MISLTKQTQTFGDLSLEWKQFQDLCASQTAQSLKLDQYLLFELKRDQSPTLELCAATGIVPEKTSISIQYTLQQELVLKPGVWFIQDVFVPPNIFAPISAYVAGLGGKSAFVAHVNCEARMWGYLVGYSKEAREVGASETALFSLLSTSVALLVENVQLRYGTTFRLLEALSLETVSSAIVESNSLDKTISLIIDEAVRLLRAQDALVLLLEDGGEWFRVQERRGDDVAVYGQSRMSVKNSLNGIVVTTGEPLISTDAITDPRADQARAAGLNAHTVAIAPLKIREKTIGTIAIHNKSDGYFSQEDLNVLCSFANQAAIAINNAQLFNDLISARNEIQQKAQELQELLVQTMNIQENERQRIAGDIHDRVISQIVGALYEVEGCIQLYRKSKDLNGQLELLKQLLNEAIEQTRKSIYNLWPATLNHMSLLPALHELFKHQEALTGVPHTIQVHGSPYPLRSSVQIAAYRIVQEAMNNAFHHSKASLIDMSIHFNPKQFSIKVRDNGYGFDIQEVMQLPLACHYGLILMRERAQSIGGAFSIKSQPGKGSQIILEIPIDKAEEGEGLQKRNVDPCADR